VYALAAASGSEVWRYPAGSPVYAPLAVHEGVAYFGDSEGYVHAVRAADGRRVWAARHAAFSIESAGAIVGKTCCVGAWDAWIYAVSLKDGSVVWRARGPTGQAKTTSRYYAAADVPPVLAGGRLWITDRGYRLAAYQPDDGQ